MVKPNRLRRCDMGTIKNPKKKINVKRTETEFSLVAPQAGSVFLSGDFNEWNTSSDPLKKRKRREVENICKLKSRPVPVSLLG
jgi:1,4-alpha-glucan branching enzyme